MTRGGTIDISGNVKECCLPAGYAAAYGGERIPAYLFLPKNAKPPYQAPSRTSSTPMQPTTAIRPAAQKPPSSAAPSIASASRS
jgi:hypothetical protein